MSRKFASLVLLASFIVAMLPALVHAVEPVKKSPAKSGAMGKVEPQVVEMFEAMKSGQIEVTFIPKDATEANVLFKNKTDKPVLIKLPDAFAGVPVLAQFGGGCMGMGGMGMGGMGGGGMGGMQGMGGGMGGMMGGMGGMGMGGMGMGGMGGFMNVGAEKVGKLKVPLVCLEHGKKDPNPRVKYEIRPIETFTQKAEVIELCKMVGRFEIAQNSAQAAAWHLSSGLSWEELAMKDRVRLLNGYTEKFFTPEEIVFAARISVEAHRRAKELPAKTVGKGESLSQK